MSHSLLSANSQTHVKIVVVALVGAILVVLGGITAHVNASRDIARLQAHAPVVKAVKSANYAGQSGPSVR
jgi:hypothetical protein